MLLFHATTDAPRMQVWWKMTLYEAQIIANIVAGVDDQNYYLARYLLLDLQNEFPAFDWDTHLTAAEFRSRGPLIKQRRMDE